MSPHQIIAILWKRSWMIGLALISTMVGAAGIMLLVPPRYDATATATVDPGQTDPVTGQSAAGSNMLGVMQGNLVALVLSQRVATEVVKRLNLSRDSKMAAAYINSTSRDRMSVEEWIASEYLLKNIDAKFTPVSNIMTIKYKSNSPTQAALIANTFLAVFLDTAVELKTTAATQTATWFAPQMEKMKTELKDASDKLAKFQRETNLLATNKDGTDTESSRLVAISNELTTARNQLLLLQSQTNSLDEKDKTASQKNATLLPDSSTLVANKVDLAKVNAEISKLRSEVGDSNPKLSGLLASRRSLETQIRSEISNRDVALRQQVKFLEAAREAQLQRLITAQSERDQLASLLSEVQSRQAQIESANKVAGDARLQSRLSFLNITTLDKAIPPGSAAFPKFFIIIPLGIGAGLALGIIFALLAEAFDRRIRGLSDLEFAGSAPIMLGTMLSLAPPRRFLSFSRVQIGKTASSIKGLLPGPKRPAITGPGRNKRSRKS